MTDFFDSVFIWVGIGGVRRGFGQMKGGLDVAWRELPQEREEDGEEEKAKEPTSSLFVLSIGRERVVCVEQLVWSCGLQGTGLLSLC